jgi:hemerythrin-like metal-binding protein
MTVIDWNESYSVGVAELDEQHRGLLKILNNLSTAKQHHSDPSVFFETLNDLTQYAQNHFTTEERYMAEYGYPGLQAQKKDHESFIEKVFLLNEQRQRGDADLCANIIAFLKDWYLSHILGMDKQYEKFFNEKGVS